LAVYYLDLPVGFRLGCGSRFRELEFVLLHIHATASEGYAFYFEAEALFAGRIAT